MRFACITVLMFATAALAQTTDVSLAQSPAPLKARTSAGAAAAAIPPTAPVITIVGLCEGVTPQSGPRPLVTKKSSNSCTTVITRSQFDALAEALQPNMSASGKGQLAALYPKLLLMQREFRKLGLADDPKVKEALAFSLLRSQAEETAKFLKARSDSASLDAEIERYYKESASSYAQVELLRLFIPDDKPSPSTQATPEAAPAEATASSEESRKQRIESLHARAVAGEDFDALQAEAYKLAGMPGEAPKTNIGNLTDNDLPMNQRVVLSLKVGEVSQPIPATDGVYIFKVASKSIKPLAEVRPQIKARLTEQLFSDSLQKVENSAKVEYNKAYFPLGADAMGGMSSAGLLKKGIGGKGASSTRRSRGSGMKPSVPPSMTLPAPQTTAPASAPPASVPPTS